MVEVQVGARQVINGVAHVGEIKLLAIGGLSKPDKLSEREREIERERERERERESLGV